MSSSFVTSTGKDQYNMYNCDRPSPGRNDYGKGAAKQRKLGEEQTEPVSEHRQEVRSGEDSD